jgi:catechol 2,3-dioxygenase-like lactoylglutathione lyase family enzyme
MDRYMTIKLMGVHHIMVTVGDIEVAKQFYESVLGLVETECPVKDGNRVWYKLGNQELHVNLHNNHRAGISHFALSIEPGKYHAYYNQVKNSGYEKVTESHLYEADGLHRFYVDDPFDNTIEVTDGQINT